MGLSPNDPMQVGIFKHAHCAPLLSRKELKNAYQSLIALLRARIDFGQVFLINSGSSLPGPRNKYLSVDKASRSYNVWKDDSNSFPLLHVT